MSAEGTLEYDNLLAGCQKKPVDRPGVVALGQSWSRGQIVGLLTSSGKWQTADEDNYAAYDDVGIAKEAIDSTSGETRTSIFVEGEFNKNELIPSYGDAVADWSAKFALHGIYLREALTVEGV